MSPRHRTFIDLPSAVFALAPELETTTLPEETHATCERCVMLGEEHGDGPWPPWAFSGKTRCCTYYPPLPNFLLGRALRRGGEGAELIRRRLAEPDGRTAWGAVATADDQARYHTRRFGSDVSIRCPYWSEAANTCGVWADRGAICRTWYCRLDAGEAGRPDWLSVARTLTAAWETLARFCLASGDAPAPDAPSEEWERYYVACADRVDAATDEDLASHVVPELAAERRALSRRQAAAPASIPPRLAAVFSHVARGPGQRWVFGAQERDGLTLPTEVVDGRTPWREALAAARAEGAADLDEAVVVALWQRGLLGAD